jgi:hypothetical protein
MITAIVHNRQLVQELQDIMTHHQMGLFMDVELLRKAQEIGSKLREPEPHEIDPQTGLSHKK